MQPRPCAALNRCAGRGRLAAPDRVMNINFYGTLRMTRTFLPHLLERPEAHIVNTSSMGGFLPVPGQAIYGASKVAVTTTSSSAMTPT